MLVRSAVLRVNRTTSVRALTDFGDELVTIGATRSTRYALRRPVGNAGSRWPIYVVDESGQARVNADNYRVVLIVASPYVPLTKFRLDLGPNLVNMSPDGSPNQPDHPR